MSGLVSLLDARLIMVTGKGGTGKTSVAEALAILAASQQKRVVLAELDSQRPSMDAVFSKAFGYDPIEVGRNLSVCNVEFAESMAAYLRRTVPIGRVVKLVLKNKYIGRFLDFTPGTREVVILSRLAGLLEQFDQVIVDMPASGHAFSTLDVLRSVLKLFESGPVRERSLVLRDMLHDPSTRMVFVALAEEMVVNETIETLGKMRAGDVVGGAPLAVLNRATLPSLLEAERAVIQRLWEADLAPMPREFVRAGMWEDRLEQATASAQKRLVSAFDEEAVLIPPVGGGGVPRDVVTNVAVHMGRSAGITRRDLGWT